MSIVVLKKKKLMFDRKRPLSWTAISSFEYDPEQWYDKYVLLKTPPESAEMRFGKMVGKKLAKDPTFLPAVIRYPRFEHELKAVFNKVPLIGFIDTSHIEVKRIREYKTGKRDWDQKRVDTHGQIDMYLLMIYIIYKIKPEEMMIHLDWLPTIDTGDFKIGFRDNPVVPFMFETKRTMADVLRFGQRINETIMEMEQYCLNHD